MPPHRTSRIITIVLALVAVAAVGGSVDPFGPSAIAGRRWHPAVDPTGPAFEAPAVSPVLALAEHRGRRWR